MPYFSRITSGALSCDSCHIQISSPGLEFVGGGYDILIRRMLLQSIILILRPAVESVDKDLGSVDSEQSKDEEVVDVGMGPSRPSQKSAAVISSV